MGTDQGIYPCVGTLVMGNLMGRRFWVGRGCFFLEGRGVKRKHQVSQQGRSLDDAHFQTAPFCSILYVEQWGFRCSMSSGHREGGPRSSIALDSTCLFRLRQPVDLVHVLKTVKGLCSSFRHGLHGAVSMMFMHMWSIL